jgi:hypothetical protein
MRSFMKPIIEARARVHHDMAWLEDYHTCEKRPDSFTIFTEGLEMFTNQLIPRTNSDKWVVIVNFTERLGLASYP